MYPYLVAAVEYRFDDRWTTGLYADGIAIADDWVLDTSIALKYRAGRAWDFVAGYKYFSRKVESDVMYNKVRYHVPFLGVSRFW